MPLSVTSEPLHMLSATEALRKITSDEITVRQYIESCMNHTEKCEPKVKAWVVLDRKHALAQADELDAQLRAGNASTAGGSALASAHAGKTPGKIFGMPVGVKDVFNTKDFPTRRGCPIR